MSMKLAALDPQGQGQDNPMLGAPSSYGLQPSPENDNILALATSTRPELFCFADGQPIKFWISAYCPNRAYYIKTVRDHGGEIVMSPSNVDVLKIADPFRADKLDSVHVSYKFIDACIKNQNLLDPSEFTIKPEDPTLIQRKRTRVKNTFTPEDDDILIRNLHYIDVSASQKTIYKQLAERYPQHSWQSWRERYYKNLRKALGPPVRYKYPDNSTKNPEHAAPHHRVKFTQEDDEILREALQSGEWALQGQHLYKLLASKYPRHTSQSWRDRAIKYVAPRHNLDSRSLSRSQMQDPLLSELLTYKQNEDGMEKQKQRGVKRKKVSEPTTPLAKADGSSASIVGAMTEPILRTADFDPTSPPNIPAFSSHETSINDPAHSMNLQLRSRDRTRTGLHKSQQTRQDEDIDVPMQRIEDIRNEFSADNSPLSPQQSLRQQGRRPQQRQLQSFDVGQRDDSSEFQLSKALQNTSPGQKVPQISDSEEDIEGQSAQPPQRQRARKRKQ